MLVPRPVEPDSEGGFRLRLSDGERELLRTLPGELRRLLDSERDDPGLRRLFPPAYERDEESEDEYRRLMSGELLEGRRAALRLVEETADRDRLTAEELDGWLRALNDLRLVFGTRLDVTEDMYQAELDPAHPQAHELSVYAYLSWLQEQLVAAAAGDLG
ncbi:MAG: DUF2017 family protein [Gaiellaceae bacterium]